MNILIKSAKIIDSESKHHEKIRDILIINGKIKKISKEIKSYEKYLKNKRKIDFTVDNLHVSPGWFDMHADICDPGDEHKETFKTGREAAAFGGYTGILASPNTNPAIDNHSMVQYIKEKNRNQIVDVFPAGCITINSKGDNIVEIHDMVNEGCLAFTDDKRTIMRNDVLKIAMLYAKDSNSLLMSFANDETLSYRGHMHEGKVSMSLGLKGIPSLAEEIMINRDINLCEYTNSKLHISHISTKKSVEQVKKARKKGLSITSDVNIYNLFLTDEFLENFESNYKLMPPIRTEKDNNALLKGLRENVIDVITTDHRPQDEESKKTTFSNASFGIIGLETAFGLLGKHILPHIGLNKLIEKISINPRRILKLESATIKEGNKANITFFDPTKKWTFKIEDRKSKSKNTPFDREELYGKAIAIYNNGQFLEC